MYSFLGARFSPLGRLYFSVKRAARVALVCRRKREFVVAKDLKVNERRVKVHTGPGPSRTASVRESYFQHYLKRHFERMNGKWLPKRGHGEIVRRLVAGHLIDLEGETS